MTLTFKYRLYITAHVTDTADILVANSKDSKEKKKMCV
jgi:hypothetical protein